MADLDRFPDPPRRRKPWLIPAIVAGTILLVVVGWLFWRSPTTNPSAGESSAKASDKAGKGQFGGKGKGGGKGGKAGAFSNASPVAVAPAQARDVNVIQTGLGTVTALRTVTVKTRADGQLNSVAFAEGQIVQQGATLAQIDPVPYQVALEQAEGQLARDAATLNNARLDLERYRTLLAQDSIASQQVDQQASLVKQLEGTVKIDQANLDTAKLNLSYTKIVAPIGGRVGLRLVDPGNQVRGSDSNGIAVITQLDPITVLFTIPQDTLPRILQRLNSGDKPPVEAWDRGNQQLLAKGFLVTTDNQIDVTTGTVKLRAQFANPQGQLFPNQFVNVRMTVYTLKNAVTVPTAAIQRSSTQGTIVYVVQDDDTIAVRPVTTGPAEGELTSIESGVKVGERVVTDGVDRIREGMKVDVAPPQGPAAQPGAAAPGAPNAKGDYRKRLEGMTPEEREAAKKKYQSMSPEERDAARQRRQGTQGSTEKSVGK
ncbi:MAG TPA: MdtA/MuxA family multidrug efflux RND transporter periplasmic adaptor subunit [Usitatibacter sp.]|jgi:multidrug efflux system membrane fusion protein|nr:MdtA/MuxA family multidrug efflux RND transporter periplasmic adaptor subunit [Usitatibacter sp.]